MEIHFLIQKCLDLYNWQLKAIEEGIKAVNNGDIIDFETIKKQWEIS